ncbi:uncharacterized protein N7479_001257 [Penicillium vulpinum]|uniref:Uncharacterized protein n=1 Tax=Penicillium vulpinum TaxID=29845 RepID=A0A1V6RZP5_9EURO|nr:uncharacterized protein N7479_001257 [Penicillium vulpinum]KAJ5971339.1 hypothetical protein N7479_001257 [Penicillium vulpinum]OQE06979.1 hypothetical protein PENVUL_c015G06414 [Penicillium vulpinum]
MATSRTLYLTSTWSLEDRGISELREKLNALNPGASIKVQYLGRDKHILVVTGQFDNQFDSEVTSLLANYIEEHRNDDLLEMPRVRQLPTSTKFDPNSLPSYGSDVQPNIETLVEDMMPAQPTSDGPIVKFWYPSQVALGPISSVSDLLVLRLSETVDAEITIHGTRGLRISAQHMGNIDKAMDLLDSLEECLDLIENPNRGLIIFTPKRDSATFRIMAYADISATALWRILIKQNSSLQFPKIMTLVVCEFDELANEFRPLRKLRQPPQVALKEASITRDWKDYHLREICPKNDPLLKEIDQHLAPQSEISHEKSDSQHPYLSTGKAKDVDKWISRGVAKRPLSIDTHAKGPLENDPTSPELVASKPPHESSVSAPRDQRRWGPFKPKPVGIKGRAILLPDGTVAPSSQSRPENPIDTPYGPHVSVFSRLSYRERVRGQPIAGSSVSVPQEKRPIGILRSATDSTAPRATSKQSGTISETTGPAASTYSTSTQEPKAVVTSGLPFVSTHLDTTPKQSGDASHAANLALSPANQEEKPTSAPHQPIRSRSPRVDETQPLGTPEAVDLQVDKKPRGRSVDSVMGEIKLMLETAKITRDTGTEELSGKPKTTDQKQSSSTSTGPDLSREKTENLGSLLDFDCDVRSFNSGLQHIATLDPLAIVPPNVPEQATAAQHDQSQHGEAPTFAETGDNSYIPNIDDTAMQHQRTQSISHHPEPIQDLMILRATTSTPVPSEPAQPEIAADTPLSDSNVVGSCHKSTACEDKQKNEQAPERRSKADEIAMEYLLQQIKDNPTPVVPSIEDIALSLDTTPGDPAPRDLSSSSHDRFPRGSIQQRQHSDYGAENVPFLHPDLIDISSQMLSPRLGVSNCDSVQQSDSKSDEQDAESNVGENLAVSEEIQTREFRETMFHQRPPDKPFQWVNEVTKVASMAKTEAHSDNDKQKRKNTEANAENEAKLEASLVNLWQRRKGSKSTEGQSLKGTALAIKEALKPSREKKLIHDSTESLFYFLQPILDAVRIFPGALSLQIQFGLMFMPSVPASTKEREMSYREVHQLFFSKHNLTPPPISFFERLTTSPADIDYLIDLEVNQSRLFDQNYSHRGVKYEFWCRVGLKKTIVISVNGQGHAMIRYPEVSLGTVHLSFPSQVWDAAARVQGFIEYITGADPELEEAARMMAKSIRIEPDNQQLRMLVRLPPPSKIRIYQVSMERWSRHPYCSERSKDLFLQITETQELLTAPSVLDPGIMVIQNAPLEKMVKDGKQWWQASIVSSKVDGIMKSNSFLEPGERNESWCATDLLGADITNVIPTANQELSTLGAEVGHSGIGAMFQLAKTVVQKIDAVGHWNRGPASTEKRTNTSNDRSQAGTGTRKQSSTDLGKQLVPWSPTPPRSNESKPDKHKW